jgi:nitrite reductase/ring-hydroxylating ferredoxin subunit
MSNDWILAGEVEDFKEGGHKLVDRPREQGDTVSTDKEGVSNRKIAVYRVNGEFYAMSNECAHKQASLCEGDIEDIAVSCKLASGLLTGAYADDGQQPPGLCVRCPKHRKKFPGGLYFSLEDGRAYCKEESEHWEDGFRVDVFPVAVSNGNVYVGVTPKNPVPQNSQQRGSTSEAGTKKAVAKQFSSWTVEKIEPYHVPDVVLVTVTLPEIPDQWRQRLDNWEQEMLAWHVCLRLPEMVPSSLPGSSSYSRVEGSFIERDYTPVSDWGELQEGRLRFLIRLYPGGKFSNALLHGCRVGATMEVSEPEATIVASRFPMAESKQLVLIAGGTGITPVLQLLEEALPASDMTTSRSKRSFGRLNQWEDLQVLLAVKNSTELLMLPELLEVFSKIPLNGRTKSLRVFLSRSQPGRQPSAEGSISDTSPVLECDQMTALEDALHVNTVNSRIDTQHLDSLISSGSRGRGEESAVVVVGPQGLLDLVSSYCAQNRPDSSVFILEA